MNLGQSDELVWSLLWLLGESLGALPLLYVSSMDHI